MDFFLDYHGFGVGFTAAEAHVSDHLDRRDRRPHHTENLLGDRVPNVVAG